MANTGHIKVWTLAECEKILKSLVNPVGKFLRGQGVSAEDALRLNLLPHLMEAPIKERTKYGPRRNLTAQERADQLKERNKQHARHTRRRRRVFKIVAMAIQRGTPMPAILSTTRNTIIEDDDVDVDEPEDSDSDDQSDKDVSPTHNDISLFTFQKPFDKTYERRFHHSLSVPALECSQFDSPKECTTSGTTTSLNLDDINMQCDRTDTLFDTSSQTDGLSLSFSLSGLSCFTNNTGNASPNLEMSKSRYSTSVSMMQKPLTFAKE